MWLGSAAAGHYPEHSAVYSERVPTIWDSIQTTRPQGSREWGFRISPSADADYNSPRVHHLNDSKRRHLVVYPLSCQFED